MARNTPEQAARKSSPVHRGYDGHLPCNPVDTGYVAPRSPGVEALAKKGELIDFAPSILNLLCRPALPTRFGADAVENFVSTRLY